MTEELLKHVFMSYIFLEEPDLRKKRRPCGTQRETKRCKYFNCKGRNAPPNFWFEGGNRI